MNAFLFSYGGKNNIGKIIKLGTPYNVDFPTEDETCYGLAFRRDVDISFKDKAKKVTIEFKSDKDFDAIIEFKTLLSNGAPEESFTLSAKEGLNSFTFPIPSLKSKIKEICFCIFKDTNKNLKAEVTVLDFLVK